MINNREYDDIPVSACCGADMPEWPDCDLCPLCLEHSEPEDSDADTPSEMNNWLRSAGY